MFLLAFLLYPIVELVVFILVVKATSLGVALLLTLATSLLGVVIAKLQKRGPIFGSSGISENSLKNYLFGNLGAFALILPGFVTDVLGLLILVPFTRNALMGLVKLCKIDLYRNANGNFSVFKTWSFSVNNFHDPHRRSEYGTPNGDQDLETSPSDDDLNDAPALIDVEFTPKD